MQWTEIRKIYPDQWLVVEALAAHTEEAQRLLDEIAVVEVCQSGDEALQRYRKLHLEHPAREFYFVHTDRETLDIGERHWLGIRRQSAARPA